MHMAEHYFAQVIYNIMHAACALTSFDSLKILVSVNKLNVNLMWQRHIYILS